MLPVQGIKVYTHMHLQYTGRDILYLRKKLDYYDHKNLGVNLLKCGAVQDFNAYSTKHGSVMVTCAEGNVFGFPG